jgi:hypothetical protein
MRCCIVQGASDPQPLGYITVCSHPEMLYDDALGLCPSLSLFCRLIDVLKNNTRGAISCSVAQDKS